jgi:hypothetical protein
MKNKMQSEEEEDAGDIRRVVTKLSWAAQIGLLVTRKERGE